MKFNRKKYSRCDKCPLRDRKRVWGIGSNTAKVCLVGEAPGADEDEKGIPFVGKAGRFLDKALYAAKLRRESIWLTNVISCRPTGNNISSAEAREAIRCCKPGYEAELSYLVNEVGVRVIGTLGNTPTKSFDIPESITKARGSVYQDSIKRKKFIIIPTFHPSFIMRGQVKEEGTWVADLVKIKELSKKPYKPPKENFNLFPTIEDIEEFRDKVIKDETLIGIDIESTSLVPEQGEIVCIGMATSGEDCLVYPILKQGNKEYWTNGSRKKTYDMVKEILLKCPTMYQNALFDVPYLTHHGFKVGILQDDTMLMHHAMHPELSHTLGYIGSIYAQTPYWKDEFLKREGRILDMPDDKLRTYNARDSVVLHQIYPDLLADLKESGTYHVYRNFSMELINPVWEMTSTGLFLDKKEHNKWKRYLKKELEVVEKKIRDLTKIPDEFNLNSDDHKRLLIYGVKANQFKVAIDEYKKYQDKNSKLRRDTKKYRDIENRVKVFNGTTPLYVPKNCTLRRTESGSFSLNNEALLGLKIAVGNRLSLVSKLQRKRSGYNKELRALKQWLDFYVLYREYQKLEKLRSTYTRYNTWKDGRIHPQYKIHGTTSGRLSSNKPNAQNFPKEARKIIGCEEGNILVKADYSNLELRVLAYISNDDVLINLFDEGKNAHDENTKTLFKLTPDSPDWTPKRKVSKTWIFRRNYGGGLKGMYDKFMLEFPDLVMTFAEFKEADKNYFESHPRYKEWRDNLIEEIISKRELTNPFGRKRLFLGYERDITREGLNFPMQSTAADIINTASIGICKEKKELGLKSKLIHQEHDALMFECPIEEKTKMIKIMKKHMEQPFEINGRKAIFPADFEVGKSWGKLKEI